jgi:hypothetical protein
MDPFRMMAGFCSHINPGIGHVHNYLILLPMRHILGSTQLSKIDEHDEH